MKQTDRATAMGVSKGTVSVWERSVRYPEMETIQNLASFFNVPLSTLLDGITEISGQSHISNNNHSDKDISAAAAKAAVSQISLI
ncbi:MAG: helix-turn-helix transcriptional regulator [Christensenellaceae bacterium]|nr:helix-turn-helix transcriptional regulator [Christensenellaceae bacterium]